jgi:transposase
MSEREQKALVIAAKSKIARKGDTWVVPSQTGSGKYTVDADLSHCTCPDHELRKVKCKHIIAVEYTLERERSVTETTDGDVTTTTVTETVKVTKRVTYKQDWTAYNTAQTNEKHLFESLLHDLCDGIVEPFQKMGRPRLMYKDMLFASAFKVYCGMSARRFNTDFCEAQIKGHVSKSAHFNSVNRYLANPALTPLLRDLITYSSLPLKAIETDFAVDSSGFSTCQYVRWFDAKYGKEVDVHDWLKVHLMTGVKTHVVTSVEITGRHANDSPLLPPLVNATANNFTIKEVSADKGYSSTDNHDAIAKVGATPYIAFKSNATGGVGGLFEKMFHFYSYKRDEFLAAYHKRSNVESTFSMVKAKFGGHIRSKGEAAQINEALCKILCHNICCLIQSMFEFGIEPTFGSKITSEPKVA